MRILIPEYRRRGLPLMLLASIAILFTAAQPANAQMVLRQSVFGIGGGGSSDGEHRMFVTLGQPFVGGASNAVNGLRSGFWQARTRIVQVDVEKEELEDAVPRQYSLHQNYPNPFNPETTILYEVQAPVHVVLKVFNLLGREVATVVDALRVPGRYTVRFGATGLPSGTYFYRVEMGDFRDVKMMTLVR